MRFSQTGQGKTSSTKASKEAAGLAKDRFPLARGLIIPCREKWELYPELLLRQRRVSRVDSLMSNYVAELTPSPPLEGGINLHLSALPRHLFSLNFRLKLSSGYKSF